MYLPSGKTVTSGSFLAGVHLAQSGIIMEADPQIPHAFRQECFGGEAEDTASPLISFCSPPARGTVASPTQRARIRDRPPLVRWIARQGNSVPSAYRAQRGERGDRLVPAPITCADLAAGLGASLQELAWDRDAGDVGRHVHAQLAVPLVHDDLIGHDLNTRGFVTGSPETVNPAGCTSVPPSGSWRPEPR